MLLTAYTRVELLTATCQEASMPPKTTFCRSREAHEPPKKRPKRRAEKAGQAILDGGDVEGEIY